MLLFTILLLAHLESYQDPAHVMTHPRRKPQEMEAPLLLLQRAPGLRDPASRGLGLELAAHYTYTRGQFPALLEIHTNPPRTPCPNLGAEYGLPGYRAVVLGRVWSIANFHLGYFDILRRISGCTPPIEHTLAAVTTTARVLSYQYRLQVGIPAQTHLPLAVSGSRLRRCCTLFFLSIRMLYC